MATTINADTTTGGAIVTGDASGQLELQAAGVTKLTVASGGVTLATPLAVASGGTGGTATPTAGGIVYGTGTVQAVTAAGTSGQLLQSNGASAPTWVTPASGLTLLSTVTASNSATVDIETTFNSTYDVYIIQATGVTVASGNVGLYCRFKIGGSYIASGTPYSYAADHTGQADTSYQINRSTAADQIEVVASGDIGNASTEYTTFEMRIDQVASTALYKTVTWVGMSLDTGGVYLNQRGGGRITNAGALTGIRFLATSGNIAAGKFRLYGLANS